MRITRSCLCLVATVLFLGALLQGCTSPGPSPSQVQASSSSDGYVDRGFNGMQAELP